VLVNVYLDDDLYSVAMDSATQWLTANGVDTDQASIVPMPYCPPVPNGLVGYTTLEDCAAIHSQQATPAQSGTASPKPSSVSPLRSVNWSAVFAQDPGVSSVAESNICNYGELPLAVRFKQDPTIKGHPWPDRAVYGDLDGDGVEEVVIPLLESCTGGAENSLIYQATPSGPRAIASAPGVGRGTELSYVDGMLQARTAIYRNGEPLCCPTGGTQVTTYRLQGTRLVPGDSYVEPQSP
jgi:hypothetical protein